MAVGSGSIKRVQKAAANMQGDAPVAEEVVKPVVKEDAPEKPAAKKPAAKKTAVKSAEDKPKKVPAKKAQATTTAAADDDVKKAAKKDDIHEKKFQVVSKIKSDLPDYLL